MTLVREPPIIGLSNPLARVLLRGHGGDKPQRGPRATSPSGDMERRVRDRSAQGGLKRSGDSGGEAARWRTSEDRAWLGTRHSVPLGGHARQRPRGRAVG